LFQLVTMTEEKKMSQKTIQSNLDSIEKMNGFLQELIDKTNRDNITLKLGDQLRPTEDYNGTLFEVVREPYWCCVDESGRAKEQIIQQKEEEFGDDLAQAEDYMKILEKRKVDPDGHQPGILSVAIRIGKERKYEITTPGYEFYDDDNEKQDENGEYYIEGTVYTVVYKERIQPDGWIPQRRIWIRKICIISKAEGHTDDKNLRSLPFPIRVIPFRNLIMKEINKLSKISRNLEATRLGAKKASKTSMRSRNEEKYQRLFKLWVDPATLDKQISGFYSDKYGLFLKSDVKYEVSARAVNPATKIINDAEQIKSQVEIDG
jgi:hypothetical protein